MVDVFDARTTELARVQYTHRLIRRYAPAAIATPSMSDQSETHATKRLYHRNRAIIPGGMHLKCTARDTMREEFTVVDEGRDERRENGIGFGRDAAA